MGRRVYLQVDVLPEGIEEWHAAYARFAAFVQANHEMYGVAADAAALDAEQREMLLDVYNGDPSAAGQGAARADQPPPMTVGRLEIELFDEQVPKTSDNFFHLCVGDKGKGKAGKPLNYSGCPIHRIAKGFVLQGGDIVKGDGSGGDSIYGGKFNDEKPGLKLKHDARGILSMANSGKNSNTSQFFITLGPQPKLDGKHVPFGRVVAGLDVLDKIEATAAPTDGPPLHPIRISACGAC